MVFFQLVYNFTIDIHGITIRQNVSNGSPILLSRLICILEVKGVTITIHCLQVNIRIPCLILLTYIKQFFALLRINVTIIVKILYLINIWYHDEQNSSYNLITRGMTPIWTNPKYWPIIRKLRQMIQAFWVCQMENQVKCSITFTFMPYSETDCPWIRISQTFISF